MTTHLTPELARAYLDELCARIDRAQPISRPSRSWWKLIAVGVAVGAAGCGGKAALPPPESGPVEVCDDGKDNDSDGKIDCADADCQSDAACQVDGGAVYAAPVEVCDDGADNDGDGEIDCVDRDCVSFAGCAGELYAAMFEDCTDGVDNDGDGRVDCADPDCAGSDDCGTLLYAAPF